MTTLVVSIPARHHLSPGQGSATATPNALAAPGAPAEFEHVFSTDGLTVTRIGRAAPALLPRADEVVAVLPAADLSWHRITCPRAAPAKLPAALVGVLEEAVLEDPQQLHFALAPGARGGEIAWVAATDRRWLEGAIAALESAGHRVDRVVPGAWPDDTPRGHFHTRSDTLAPAEPLAGLPQQAPGTAEPSAPADLWLSWAHAEGVVELPLRGSLARALVPEPPPADARFTATPAAAATAERWLGHSVSVLSAPEAALQAARSPWDLRQFGLAPRHRGLAVLREALRSLLGPAWRPVRWGLSALVVVQLVGLNLAAWQQNARLSARRADMSRLLTTAHPQVRSVLDPALQMQRETDLLRVAAGRSGEADLEAALQVVASAWGTHAPAQSLGFESGRLTLGAPGWSAADTEALARSVAPVGWQLRSADGLLTLSRRTEGGSP